MRDTRDQVDISTRKPDGDAAQDAGGSAGAPPGNSGWLGLYFKCAGVYVRAYKNQAGTAYRGRCPRCGKSMDFLIGPGGTNRRNFEVSC